MKRKTVWKYAFLVERNKKVEEKGKPKAKKNNRKKWVKGKEWMKEMNKNDAAERSRK